MKGYNGSTAETFAKTASNVTFTSLTGGSTGDEEKYDDLRYTIIGGKVHITAYVGSGNDKVIVPAKIGGKDVTAIDANAFLRCDAVTVILPESIESISERAFAGCSKLKTIVILDKCRSIDSTAFNDTTSLTIRGLRNSYAQMYASDKNIAFSALSDSEYKCLSGTHGETRTDRKEATCKEEGYERTICTVCGEVIKETKLPKPTSHTYETKTVAPTCTEKATRFIPVNHAATTTRTTKPLHSGTNGANGIHLSSLLTQAPAQRHAIAPTQAVTNHRLKSSPHSR